VLIGPHDLPGAAVEALDAQHRFFAFQRLPTATAGHNTFIT